MLVVVLLDLGAGCTDVLSLEKIIRLYNCDLCVFPLYVSLGDKG